MTIAVAPHCSQLAAEEPLALPDWQMRAAAAAVAGSHSPEVHQMGTELPAEQMATELAAELKATERA